MSYDPFIGEIKIFGFNFAPRGYFFCNGQILSLAQNTALFALIGTTYGGNGQTTFGLPNLQSRVPIGAGTNAGSTYTIGEMSGTTSVTLTTLNLPAHTHPATGISINVPASEGGADTDSPVNAVLANTGSGLYAATASTNGSAAPITASGTLAPAGSSMPIEIENPYLALNYSIAIEGIFPSRN
jgi:microcystin-dependent protein